MPTMGFARFLKLASLDTPAKFSEMATYLTPGGYDFYWSSRQCISSIATGEMTRAEASKQISALKKPAERKHNLARLKTFLSWYDRQAFKSFRVPPKVFPSPSHSLLIKVDPELSFQVDGERLLVSLWNTQSVPLTAAAAAEGILIMQKSFRGSAYADCRMGVLDLTKVNAKLHLAVPSSPRTEAMLRHDISSLETIWTELVEANSSEHKRRIESMKPATQNRRRPVS